MSSSDGKPLWGFRKIFFFQGLVWIGAGLWVQWSVINPPSNPTPNDMIVHWSLWELETFLVALLILGAADLWFWRQLRSQRFTPRNWWIGLVLLLPLFLFCGLPGLLTLFSWFPQTCKSLFYAKRTS